MPFRYRLARAAPLAAISLLAAACSRPLDIDGLESQLKAIYEKEFDATDLTVTCPDGVKAEAGSTFQCQATDATGATVVITVTQIDDQGKVKSEITDAST